MLTCARPGTRLTVGSPGLPNGAAAQHLGQISGQRVFAAPRLRHYQKALTLLSWSLQI